MAELRDCGILDLAWFVEAEMSESTLSRRRPAVAGMFYPSRPERLQAEVNRLLAEAEPADLPAVRALIVPHAGYRYSGPIAASAFRQLGKLPDGARRKVYLLGPAHYVFVNSIALAPVDCFETPLGDVPQDREAIAALARDKRTYQPLLQAHEPEHCLEVELPFLQTVLGDFDLVAMLCGEPPPAAIASDLAGRLGPDDLVVVSSDLSHFYRYEEAQRLDRSFLAAVLAGDLEAASRGEACGQLPILILMHLAQSKGWQPTLLDYRNSGDTEGDRYRVVGYAAVAYHETVR